MKDWEWSDLSRVTSPENRTAKSTRFLKLQRWKSWKCRWKDSQKILLNSTDNRTATVSICMLSMCCSSSQPEFPKRIKALIHLFFLLFSKFEERVTRTFSVGSEEAWLRRVVISIFFIHIFPKSHQFYEVGAIIIILTLIFEEAKA